MELDPDHLPFQSHATAPELPVRASSVPKSSVSDRSVRALRMLSYACAGLVILISLLVLCGWLFGIEPLMTVLPGYIRMKSNTAAGFIAAGGALVGILWNRHGSRRWAQALALLTFALGASALTEYFAAIDLGIDQIFFRDPVQLIHPGRMAPISAACFCVAAISLLFLSGRRMARILTQCAALLLIAAAFAAMVSYLYGAELFYGSLGYTSMALHTGVSFLVLGIGIILAQPQSMLASALAAPERGGWLVRRLLPVIVLLPVAIGWLYLQPQINFDHPRFGMALFAVTLAASGSIGLLFVGIFLTREQRQRAEISRIREETAAAIRQSERELRLINDHLPTLLFYMDTSERLIRVNRTYELWTGLSSEAIVGRTLAELLGRTFAENTLSARAAVLRGETVTFEIGFPTIDGEREAQITYAPDIDDAHQVRGIACMVLDIGERRRAEAAMEKSERLQLANEVLQELSLTDQLTGVKNRRAFDERLRIDFALAERHGRDLSLLMIDIDNFKVRNDTWGHVAGDEVLRRLGAILAASVRTPDMVARYGGEEFVILLPESDTIQARVVADRIQKSVHQETWSYTELTLSIGIGSRVDTMPGAQALVDAADAALYEAKRTGKDRVCVAEQIRASASPKQFY